MEFVGEAADGTSVHAWYGPTQANYVEHYGLLREKLPSGYPGSFGLAAFPSQWFKVMDPKLMQWAGGDITKVNVDPARRNRLSAKYGDVEQLDRPLAQRPSPPT